MFSTFKFKGDEAYSGDFCNEDLITGFTLVKEDGIVKLHLIFNVYQSTLTKDEPHPE